MRRWNPLFLVALLVVALLATVLMTPRGALAAGAPSQTSFKGKAAVYSDAGPYFVVSFTCSNGTLSGKWTFENNAGASMSGPLEGIAACGLTTSNQWSTTTASPPGANAPSPLASELLFGANNANIGTLNLFLTNIGATKTFFDDTDPDGTLVSCPSGSSACIQIDADFSNGTVFHSEEVSGFGTLTIQLPKG